MPLKDIYIENFRNFKAISVDFCFNFNVLYGENGSGKTNLLESIYYLSTGRSFRCQFLPHLINHAAKYFLLRCTLDGISGNVMAGVKKALNGEQHIHINGEKANSITELARFLPLQFLNQDGYLILSGGPKFRRQILDWGVFHVEHAPAALWRRVNQALLQRNAALKSRSSSAQIQSWDEEFFSASMDLHKFRMAYFSKLEPIARGFLYHLFGEINLEMSYYAGWNIEQNLIAALAAGFARDLRLGFTQFGPQRANINWLLDGFPPQDVLSRGQQKLFVLALYLAQGKLLSDATGKTCVFLIDDLMAELDRQKQALAINMLTGLDAQIFITSIDKNELEQSLRCCKTKNLNMFHVEQGLIKQ